MFADRRSLLALSYRFPPETYPLAMRIQYFLGHLQERWALDAVTAAADADVEDVTVHQVRPREAEGAVRFMGRLRLMKLVDWLAWPDRFVLWVLPALFRAWRLSRRTRPEAILAFCMPYTTGVVGVLLKKLTGLPLIMNLNDSPTCTDMNAAFPSRLHYRLAHWLEDWFVRNADLLVYVSRRNMERVRDRQPAALRTKFHLIRRGVRPLPPLGAPPARGETFRIVYTGGMGGWHFGEGRDRERPSLLRRLYHKWQQWGTYHAERLDPTTHSPIFIGRAIRQVVDAHPRWAGRVHLDVYGNTFPDDLTQRVLRAHGIDAVVRVHDRVSHEEALRHMQDADLLFMTLPGRVAGTPGGRISAKTYEYLMTDRPILGALPPGENTEYLADRPGVYLTDPWDVDGMADVITALAGRTFAGDTLCVDRQALRTDLLSTTRAQAFEDLLCTVVPGPVSPPSAAVPARPL
jgi:hypothetical protein